MSFSRRKFMGSALGVAGTLVLPVSSPMAQSAPAGRRLVIGCQNPRTLNPAIQSGSVTGMPASQMFAGLVLLDAHFKPQPYLAKSWEVSEDGKRYRFNLVDNARFHDGHPVRASDVVFSINAVKQYHTLMSVTYKAILDEVEALDDLTVEIRLKRAFTGLFSVLTPPLTPILPEHVYGEHAGPLLNNPANDKPVGSGPYRFVDWQQSHQIYMVATEDFFRGKPFFQELVFRLSEDSLSKTLMLERGEIDYLPFSFLRVTDLIKLRNNPDVVITSDGYDAIGPVNYVDFNLRVKPMDDVRVRRAIAHAIDKQFINQRLHHGMSRALHGPFHSRNFFYDEASLVVYEHDLDKARKLLDEAGLTAGSNGVRTRLTLDVPTFEPDSTVLVADYLKSQLRKVGLDIVLRKSTDFADWARRMAAWDYQMSMNSTFNWSDPVVGVDRSFLSSNIKPMVWTNTEGYSDPEVDAWLSEAASEADAEKRKAIYRKFQHKITQDLPFCWTNEGIYTTLYNRKIENIPLCVFGGLAPYDQIRLKGA